MIVLKILESMLVTNTIITRLFLLIFIFGILFMIIRGGKK